MLRISAIAALCIGLLVAPSFAADQAGEITWDDLVPSSARPPANPFPKLSPDQQVKLFGVAQVLMRMEQGQLSEVSREYEFAMEDMHDLREQGVDVDGLLGEIDVLVSEMARSSREVRTELDGKVVKIPGYALPLEHSGVAVKEFLLVPYVGACIHVPPPPENQMVLVRLEEPFVPENLYIPVWVIGRMEAKRMVSELRLVDGTSDISSGYAITSGKIEPYTEP